MQALPFLNPVARASSPHGSACGYTKFLLTSILSHRTSYHFRPCIFSTAPAQGSSIGELLMVGCAQRPSFKIAKLIQAARIHPIPPAKVAGHGVTSKHRCMSTFVTRSALRHHAFRKLLETNAGGAAWNFCGARAQSVRWLAFSDLLVFAS